MQKSISPTTSVFFRLFFGLFWLFTLTALIPLYAADKDKGNDILKFNDSPLEEAVVYPSWFKTSSGDLREDLKQALKEGKKGIITYFGQKHCPYCKQFIQTSLSDPNIVNYLRKNYNLIAFNIWDIDDIIDTDGKLYSTRDLSLHYKTNFTPSLIFYDRDGKPVFRLRGFYPPYKFGAALKYATEMFYKKEPFSDYLARAVPGKYFLQNGLNERAFFSPPPYNLPALLHHGKALSVFFEESDCHTCDLLHSGPLSKEKTIRQIKKMNVVQLNMWKDTPVITPQGKKTTAKDWAKQLHIFYAPTLVFFDPDGKEVIRLDSVTQFYRLLGVLNYVNQKGYKQGVDYQTWRLQQRKIRR